MKIYVISDKPEDSVVASNYINKNGHTAILSEIVTEDSRELLADLKSNTGGSFDVIIMICENAKDIAISANKIGGAMAVVCKDQDDALEAMSSTRANVIIIDSSRMTKSSLTSILGGILAEQTAEERSESTKRAAHHMQQRETEPIEPAGSGLGGVFLGIKNSLGMSGENEAPPPRAVVKRERPKAPEPEPRHGPSLMKSVKSKGFMKSLKDSLGIVDEEK